MARGRPKGSSDSRPRGRSSDPARTASYTLRAMFRVMQRLGMTQAELAAAVDLCRMSITQYKRGIALPSILRAEELAAAMDCRILVVHRDDSIEQVQHRVMRLFDA